MKQYLNISMSVMLGMLLLNACKKESTETPIEPTNGQRITLTKAANDNTNWKIWMDAAEANRAGAWIDLNNNGTKDNGESITKFGYGIEDWGTFSSGASKTIVIYGKITSLNCAENHLTALDVSKNKELTELYCNNNLLTSLDFTNNPDIFKVRVWKNNIKGDNMKRLVNSLPSRVAFSFGGTAGLLSNINGVDGNSWPAAADIAEAEAKNWSLYEWKE
ncbi:MAG: hypothetical protein QM594_12250 [Niabella sp.]